MYAYDPIIRSINFFMMLAVFMSVLRLVWVLSDMAEKFGFVKAKKIDGAKEPRFKFIRD